MRGEPTPPNHATDEFLHIDENGPYLHITSPAGPTMTLVYGLNVSGHEQFATRLASRSVMTTPESTIRKLITADLSTDPVTGTIEDTITLATFSEGLRELPEAREDMEPHLEAPAKPTVTLMKLTIDRQWSLTAAKKESFTLFCRALIDIEPEYWLVPSVMYNDNTYGEGRFPRGGIEIGWSFREDRCAVPSSALLCAEDRFAAIFTTPATATSELSSIKTFAHETNKTGLEIRVPYIESPRRYIRKFGPGALARAKERRWTIDGTFEYSRRFVIIAGTVDHGCSDTTLRLNASDAFSHVYRTAWEELVDDASVAKLVDDFDWNRFVGLRTTYLMNVHYIHSSQHSGFLLLAGRSLFPISNTFSGAFLGKNLEIAYSLYRMYEKTGQHALRDTALTTADFFCHGALENGLLYNSYHLARREWTGYSQSRTKNINTRTMGFMAYTYLRFLQRLRDHEGDHTADQHSRWFEVAKGVCDFFVSHQQPSGSFGKWWSPTGELVDGTGVNGAYIIWAMVQLHHMNHEWKYIESAERAAKYYIDEFVAHSIYWGDALDSNCIDKEGGHAVLRALLLLYGVTKNAHYLTAASQAGAYILSWMFNYTIPFDPASDLAKLRFRTLGTTAVSVAHHHLDMYGAALAVDFLRLWAVTGCEQWKRYAYGALVFVTQMIADEDAPLGYPEYFHGFQPEQYNNTEWDYIWTGFKTKGDYRNPICWVSALTLGAVLDIFDEFPELLGAAPKLPPIDRTKTFKQRMAECVRAIGVRLNLFT